MAFTPKQKHARKQPQGPTHQSPSPVRSIANAVVAKDEDLFLLTALYVCLLPANAATFISATVPGESL